MPEKEQSFRGVSLKRDLVEQVEAFIKEYREYKSVADFVHEAVRVRMQEVRKSYENVATYTKLNSDDNGVKIWNNRKRESVDIYFTAKGIRCSVDQTDTCEHIMYALSLPEVREIVRKHRKEGWKLPNV
jgi:Arc/MetJ-type ribon-helix-helix transcriptional regulator